MKTVIKAEMWDKMQYLFRKYYDRTMHAVFYYQRELDENILKWVYTEIIKQIPILHSTFHNNFIKPYWTINDTFTAADFFKTVRFGNTKERGEFLEEFVGTEIIAQGKIQLAVRLLKCEGEGDVLIVLCNHMAMDGTDFRHFNEKVAEGYTTMVEQGKFAIAVKSGTRSSEQVYKDLSDEDKKYAKSLYKNISQVKNKVKFPFTPSTKSDVSRIVREKLEAADFLAAKAKGKQMGATVNDILLASYMKALFETCEVGADNKIVVPNMCDLRRHISDKKTEGFTNLVGFMPCSLTGLPDNSPMSDWIKATMESLAPSKGDKFIGLYSLPLLKLAYTILPHFISEFAIRLGYANPLIGMSNIGVLRPEEMKMNGACLIDAWYSGAVKFKPYVQLALTTFENVITFSIAIRGNAQDHAMAREFLKKVIANVKAFIAE